MSMVMLKFLVVLAGRSLVASLSPGDCAFVGIYEEEDDFAVVLMEDVGEEKLFVTEELPETGLSIKKSFAAKTSVEDAERGSVLRRTDFEADASSLVAPTALTIFKGSASDPIPLCSVGLGALAAARKLKDEVNLVSLPLIETAEYSGTKSGSKDELLAEIRNPLNWHSLPGHGRRLKSLNGLSRQLFTIASSNSTSLTMTTTMEITVTQTMTNMEIRDMGESDGAMGTGLACLLVLVGHLLS